MTIGAPAYPKLIFREPFDDRVAWEVEQKGWYSGVTVEFEDGRRYPVVFYDPVRLAQNLESEVKWGNACLADPGMIVIPAVTRLNMERAVANLFAAHFFDHLTPIKLD